MTLTQMAVDLRPTFRTMFGRNPDSVEFSDHLNIYEVVLVSS